MVLLLCSALIGVISGLVGIGSGIFLLPLLMYFNFTLPQAVAISLFLDAVPNTLPSLWMYYKNGHLKLKPALYIVLGSTIGTFIGAYIGAHKLIPLKWILVFFLCILIGLLGLTIYSINNPETFSKLF